MSGSVILVLVLLVGLVSPLLLYVFVRNEYDNRETMERDNTERTARRDTRNRR